MKTAQSMFLMALLGLLLTGLNACAQDKNKDTHKQSEKMTYKVQKTEEEWKKELTPEQYEVLRGKGTERPFTGEYDKFEKKGSYYCAACGEKLFESSTKFDAHCGWPSFDRAIPGTVKYIQDFGHGMVRTEAVCANCGGHLGHVFKDGPTVTKDRYCINSVSLVFKPDAN